MPDDAQPIEGQGGEGTGIFDSYLQSVPEDGRDTVAAYLKDAQKHVDGRYQEAAELRKQYEPYSQIEGFNQYQPDDLAQLLAWHQQVVSSPEAYQQWLSEAAQEAGLIEQAALEQGLEPEELTRDDIQALAQQLADERVSPLEQRLQQFEQAQQVQELETHIGQTLTELHKQHGDFNEKAVLDLGLLYDQNDPDWIQKGFRDYQEIAAQAQRDFISQKTAQPDTPVTGGGTAQLQPTTSFGEARQQALARLRQQ